MRSLLIAVALLSGAPALANDAESMYQQALAALAANDSGQALRLMERVVRAERDNAQYHYMLGLAEAAHIGERGAIGAARAASRMRRAWERAVELDPGHMDARFSLLTFYAQAPGIVGGGRDKADAELAHITELDAVQGHRAKALLLMVDATVARVGNEPEEARRLNAEAVAEYGRAADLSADPEQRGAIRVETGLLCQRMEDWDCAYDAFAAAMEEDAGNMMALYQIGRTALLSETRIEDGIAALERYLEHEPVDNEPTIAWAHTRLGQIHLLQEDTGRAREQFLLALELEPDHAEARKALDELDG